MNKPKWATKPIAGYKKVKAIVRDNHYVASEIQRTMKSGIRTTTKTEIGIIVPGQVLKPDTSFSIGTVQIFEYGFSKALFDLCPLEWKNDVSIGAKRDWFNILLRIIAQMSKNSYLVNKFRSSDLNEYIGVHRQTLINMLPVDLNELYAAFSSIQLVIIDDKKFLSKMTPEQVILADKLNIKLEKLL